MCFDPEMCQGFISCLIGAGTSERTSLISMPQLTNGTEMVTSCDPLAAINSSQHSASVRFRMIAPMQRRMVMIFGARSMRRSLTPTASYDLFGVTHT
jgi:hypothetical protein